MKKNVMNDVMDFSNKSFGKIRVISKDNTVLFCGLDIAKVLGYKDTAKAIKLHCKKDGWAICPVIDSIGRTQQAKFINEGNLYRLIVNSKLPSAEKFERWVFDEVLPAIRKDGGYISSDATVEQVKKLNREWARQSKYLTDEIHDRKSVRSLIRGSNLMELEETVQKIIDVVAPAKGNIKNEIIDVAIKELKRIDAEHMMDSAKNTYIKTVAKDSVVILQDVKIGKYKRRINTLLGQAS